MIFVVFSIPKDISSCVLTPYFSLVILLLLRLS